MQTDVVVIGGGVVGLTCAWQLAGDGFSVNVVDPQPARGASWAAAGMLAPVTELHFGEEQLLHLNLAANDLWPDHAAALADSGIDSGYAACGSVMVARDGDDAAEYRRLLDFQQGLGMQVQWLRGRELRALEPALAPSVRGGIRIDGDHQVDNRALVDGLLDWCVANPLVTLTPTRVTGVTADESSVILEGGTVLASEHVVLSAGAWSGQMEGITLPASVRPVKGQLLHLHLPDGPAVSRNIRGRDCYIVSRPDGRVVVGATVEEQGFDARPTADAVRTLLQAAWELLPITAEATFVEVGVGFRPGTADNAPLLGPLTGRPQLIVATGGYRNGVLQSPLTADAVLAWVTGQTPPPATDPFALDRRFGAGL